MKRNLIFCLCLTVLLSSSCSENRRIESAIKTQLAEYPDSRVQDIYKSFCQDALGPGHLAGDSAAVAERIRYECAIYSSEIQSGFASVPKVKYVPVGDKGNYVRVDLYLVIDGTYSVGDLTRLFLDSAEQGPRMTEAEWVERWGRIAQIIKSDEYKIEGKELDLEALDYRLRDGDYFLHHSPIYSRAYHPHYLIVYGKLLDKK